MKARRTLVLALSCWLLSSLLWSQTLRPARTVWATDLAEVPAMAREVDALLEAGRLAIARTQRDGQIEGRVHERMNQLHDGVRVFGGQIVWQKEGGQVLSVTGNLFDGIDVESRPTLTADEAASRALGAALPGARAAGRTELLILPLAERFVLAYYLHVRFRTGLEAVFVDARTGEIVLRYNDLRTQSVVGLGTGTWSDPKKMSVEAAAGTNRAVDALRPYGIRTYDVNFDFESWFNYLAEADEFLATDSDNDWRDGAVVDAHAYSGYTYDYYFKRHGRNGLDDAGRVAINYVHFLPVSEEYNNAFFDPVDTSMNYGDGDGETFNFFSASLDVVAHELTHGVTEFSSGLIYMNESGALNEAFSDIMGVGAEWYFEAPGEGRRRADWVVGEDLFYDFGPFIRSLSNPGATGDPDHYSVRCRCPEDFDNGGVHINSGIINQAFYLMVQGGRNRTSGIAVQGLGASQMDHVESIFYRAFTFYLVPSSAFRDAREATLRAARELYGEG
ncbi:MAG: M4 family metallopeptidase, partial [Vicinamibacteria bacterium]